MNRRFPKNFLPRLSRKVCVCWIVSGMSNSTLHSLLSLALARLVNNSHEIILYTALFSSLKCQGFASQTFLCTTAHYNVSNFGCAGIHDKKYTAAKKKEFALWRSRQKASKRVNWGIIIGNFSHFFLSLLLSSFSGSGKWKTKLKKKRKIDGVEKKRREWKSILDIFRSDFFPNASFSI